MTTTSTQVERIDIDPQRLLVDLNIRLNANLNREFVGSIKDLGVLVPIGAVRTTSGELRVRYGHRRTLGAIEAGRHTVPVEIIGNEGTDEAAQIERIVTQHAENEHRAGLSALDLIGVVEQLSAFGMSAKQIKNRTRMKRPSVDQALAVAASELAKAAAGRYDFLSLEQSAAVAQFEGDRESVKLLIAAAKGGTFDHTAQRLSDERKDQSARAAVASVLVEEGTAIIERPKWNDAATRLERLTIDGAPISAHDHAECPGHAAFIDEDWDGNDHEAQTNYQPVYVCLDPVANGHRPKSDVRSKAESVSSPQEAEAARQERRRVLLNNKSWRSAEAVRRDWLGSFLKRKTAPKDALRFLMREIAIGGFEICQAMEKHQGMELELLCLDDQSESGQKSGVLVAALENATDSRKLVIGLGVVLAAHEAAIGIHTWRNPSWGARRYLTVLAAWGYGLSDVEQSVLDGETGK